MSAFHVPLAAPPLHEVRRRLPRLLLGLVICGVSIGMLVRADLGLGPWDVLHQGITRHTGVSIGMVSLLVGAVLLLAWVPLRERPGLGTISNVIVIGVTIDLTLLVVNGQPPLAARWAMLFCAPLLLGLGSGFYIGAGLGPGPRDGLMTAIAARGISVRVARTSIEATALLIGVLLGGAAGAGTIWFAIAVGPAVHFFLARLSLEPVAPPATEAVAGDAR